MIMKPLTKSEYTNQTIEECKAWFKEHKAAVMLDCDSASIIRWAKLGTVIYSCRYLLHGPWFCAMGDIGECIHQWSEKITPRFVAKCNLDYYMGKCQASDDHRSRNRTWNDQVAYSGLLYIISDHLSETEQHVKSLIQDAINSKGFDAESIESLAREVYDHEGDCELASSISESGLVYSHQAIGRWVGFKMAVEQLGL